MNVYFRPSPALHPDGIAILQKDQTPAGYLLVQSKNWSVPLNMATLVTALNSINPNNFYVKQDSRGNEIPNHPLSNWKNLLPQIKNREWIRVSQRTLYPT